MDKDLEVLKDAIDNIYGELMENQIEIITKLERIITLLESINKNLK